MRAYIVSEIRSVATQMSFQKLYDDKDHLSQELRNSIGPKMEDYGYKIVDVLVDDPQPTEDIIRAFNDVTASKRAQDAAAGYAEADRIRRVAEARATGEAQRISAEATVEARRIMAEGNAAAITESVKDTGLGAHYGHELVEMSIMAESMRDVARQGGRIVVVAGGSGVGQANAMHGLYAGVGDDAPDKPRTPRGAAHAVAQGGVVQTPTGKICSLDKNGDGFIDFD